MKKQEDVRCAEECGADGDAMKQAVQARNHLDRLSLEKLTWWSAPWSGSEAKQPRLAVFQHVMNTSPRPTSPDETIAFGYLRLCKFHDREPAVIAERIRELDPAFFDDYPRKSSTRFDEAFIRAVIGEAARMFYRSGIAAYRRRAVGLEAKTGGELLGALLPEDGHRHERGDE